MASTKSTGHIPSRLENIITVATICTVIAVIVFLTRLWVRLRLTRAGLGMDDWTISLAMIFSFALATLTMTLTRYGWGHDTHDLGPDVDQITGWKIFYTTIILYISSLNMVKISILSQLYRIAMPLRKWIFGLGFVIFAFDFGASFAIIFQCKPISKSFTYIPPPPNSDPARRESIQCIDFSALYMASSAVALVTDVVIFFLPMKILWSLKLPLQQRMGLLCIFSLGLFAVLACLLRLRSLRAALDDWGHDPHWTFVGSMLWSIVEVDIALVCACLACMKPLFSRLFGKREDATSTGSNSNGSRDRTLVGSRRPPSILDLDDKAGGEGGFPTIYRTTKVDDERTSNPNMISSVGCPDKEDSSAAAELRLDNSGKKT